MTEIRSVIVADPNTIMLQALSDLFERDKRFSLVATSKTAEGFLESCLRVPVDIGIVDWTIPQLGASSFIPAAVTRTCHAVPWRRVLPPS